MTNHFRFNFSKYTSAITARPENEFQLIGFGYWDFRTETMDSFRRIQPYYSLLFIISGTQYIEINNKKYAVKANEFFIMPKDIPFRSYADENDPPSHAFFEFCGSLDASYLEDAGFTLENIVQKCPEPQKVRSKFETFFLKKHDSDSFSYYEVLSLFFFVLSTFSKPQNSIHSLKEDTFITNIKNFINLHCLNPNFSIEDLTNEFFISHSYLCKKFKQKTGETVISYINEQKMLNAEHLLKTTTLSASEIAYMSGYTCYPHFITCFKKRHNLTTREYREYLKKQEMDKTEPLDNFPRDNKKRKKRRPKEKG